MRICLNSTTNLSGCGIFDQYLNPASNEESAAWIIGQLLVGCIAFHGAHEPRVVLHPGVDVVGVGAVGDHDHAAANRRRALRQQAAGRKNSAIAWQLAS